MKFLGSLVVIQTVLVLLLFMKMSSVEDRVNELSEHKKTGPEAAVAATEVPSATVQSGLDGRQIRRIVREELLAARNHELPPQGAEPQAEPPVSDPVEMEYQRELVIQELEYLKGQQKVTSAELEKLMGDIAQLDPDSRTELLKMLNQAMNRGEIKGKL